MNETESTVFEIIDWTGSNKPIPHTCITLTYNVYSRLVEGLLSRKINVQQHLPSILHEIDGDLVLPNKISNLTRKIKKYLEASGDGNDVVKELYKDPCHDLLYICTKYGITMEQLITKTFTPPDHPMANKDILYLQRLLHYKNLPWTHAEYCVNVLVCNSSAYLENLLIRKFASSGTVSTRSFNITKQAVLKQ